MLTRIIFAASLATLASDQALLYERFNPKLVPIFKSRIVRITDSQQPRALELLGDKHFIKLSESDMAVLLEGKTLIGEEMLSAQAEAADAYAIKREEEAARPFFQSMRDTFLEEAKAHRDYSRYTRSLSPQLVPYLVKALVQFEGTGGFMATLSDNQLNLVHGSLGQSNPPSKSVAVVVFLEHDVTSVSISARIAQ